VTGEIHNGAPGPVRDDGVTASAVDAFIEKWAASGGMESANAQGFLIDFCDLLGLDRPQPGMAERAKNDYTFERAVRLD
jgi:hypothetical protein